MNGIINTTTGEDCGFVDRIINKNTRQIRDEVINPRKDFIILIIIQPSITKKRFALFKKH